MKSETTVGKLEFQQLYEEESNVKQAAIWAAEETGSIFFGDDPVYTLTTADTRYFVLLRAPTRIGYCMLVNVLGEYAGCRNPYEVSVWVDWSTAGEILLTNHLLATVFKDHDIVFDGQMSRYGTRIWRDRVRDAFECGYHVGQMTDNGIKYYGSLASFDKDNKVGWGVDPSAAVKIIIRK